MLLVLALGAASCSTAAPGQSNAPSGGGDVRAYAGQTIRVAAEDNDSTTTLKQVIGDFEDATGVKVELEVFDETTLRQKLVLDFTSKTGTYDVGELQYWFVPEFAKAGYLVPLDDLLAKQTLGWADAADFPGRTLDSMKYDGKLYGLPVRLIGGLQYYRKDLVAENGWPEPKTTAEVLELARLTKEKYGDEVRGWTGRGNRDFSSFGSFGGFAASYGAKLLDDQNHPTLTSDPAWKQALTDWVTLMKDYSAPSAANMSWYEAYQEFQAGRAVQMFETSDYGSLFEDPAESKVPGKVGYAPAPTGPAGKTAQWFFSGGLAINASISAERQAAAWHFLQWRSSAETFAKELKVPDAPRFTVPSNTVLSSPDFDSAAKDANVTDYANAQRAAFQAMDPWYWPFIPEFAQVSEAFATNVSAAIAGQMSVDEVLSKSNEAIEKILSDAGYYG